MNIPPEVARTQGHHGVKGASHGVKGGRPRLQLTDEERKERKRKAQQAWLSKQQPTQTRKPPRPRRQKVDDYVKIWGKPPGEPLTPEEFAKGEALWNARVLESQAAGDEVEPEESLEVRLAHIKAYELIHGPRKPYRAPASVGRNEPCPCGSGWKFKKCCGR